MSVLQLGEVEVDETEDMAGDEDEDVDVDVDLDDEYRDRELEEGQEGSHEEDLEEHELALLLETYTGRTQRLINARPNNNIRKQDTASRIQ